MHPSRDTLAEAIRMQSVALLNTHLAAAIDLHAQMKRAHWNVCSRSFIAIPALLDRVAAALEAYSDALAERADGLGATARGTIPAAGQSRLRPCPFGIAEENDPIFAVSGALVGFGESVREAINLATAFGDVDTADLFTEISRGIDHQLWFVESHVAPQKARSQ